uniref:RING finger protein 212B-like n=1 Tax=Styela clava TaxID=7725 RepID=UPI00193AD6B0|nr:RING finger protein 212B-like [Styela clava]
MDEWVHCNLCGQHVAKGVSFYLTTCSHIFCNRCKEKGTDPCAICQRKCNVAALNDKLDMNIQTFFMSPEKALKKQIEVLNFQGKHRTMLIGHLKKKIELQSDMLKKAEKYCQNQNEEIKKLQYEKTILKKYTHALKAHVSGHSSHRPSTPRQLYCSPGLASPRVSRSRAQSPLVTRYQPQSYLATEAKYLQSPIATGKDRPFVEIQNTPSEAHRLSIRPRPADGKFGTPSPRLYINSGSAYPSRANSPLVVSTDSMYKPSPKVNLQALSAQWTGTNAKSAYFGKLGPTPPCTPKRVSQPPSACSTPMIKFGAGSAPKLR